MRTTTSIILITGLALGLFVFSAAAQDSLNIRLLGQFPCQYPGQNLRDLATDGRYAFLAAEDSGLRVLDFSDPANIVDMPQEQQLDYALGIAIRGICGYVGANCHGFHVVDLSKPDSIFSAGWCDPVGSSYHTIVDPVRPYVYTVGEFTFCLSVINVIRYDMPAFCWEDVLDEDEVVYSDIAYDNERVYWEDNGGTFLVIDMSNPYHPAITDTVEFPGYFAHGMNARNGRIVVSSDSGLAIYTHAQEISAIPILQDFIPHCRGDLTLSEDGNTVFVASLQEGIRVFDISDPTDVQLTGMYNTNNIYHIAIKDSLIFVAGYSDGCGLYCYSAPPLHHGSPPTAIITNLQLLPVYPNPFNATTTIRYTANGLTPVNLAVFDISGRLVETLHTGNHAIGEQRIQYNASHLPSGT
ncbi:MAG: T9SS type A sorting domain-containing protein, partial [Calditrichota bacterium]